MEITENSKWKRLFYISLIFNLLIIFSFLFFSFFLPSIKKGLSVKKSADSSLTAEQKAKFEQMRLEYRARVDSLWTQVGKDRLQLWEELLKPQSDSARVYRLIDRIVNTQGKVTELAYQQILRQLKIMTPEQRKERLTKLLERRRRARKD